MNKLLQFIYPVIIYTLIMSLCSIFMMNSGALEITLVSAAVSIPIMYYFFRRDERKRVHEKKKFKFKNVTYLVLLGITACIVGNSVIDLITISHMSEGYAEVQDDIYGSLLWIQILGVGFIIPIVEELIFRALGFRKLRDWMGFIPAAIISSLYFGVYHFNFEQGVYAFLLGFLMSYIYEVYDNFIASVIFHCIANLFSIMMTVTILGDIIYMSMPMEIGFSVVSFILIIVILRTISVKDN